MKEKDIKSDFFIGDASQKIEENMDIRAEMGEEDAEKFETLANSPSEISDIYEKKEHGIVGTVLKFKKWWANRKKWQKAVMISVTALLLAAGITVSFILSYFDYNYNEITTNPEELGFNSKLDKDVVNVALFGIDTRSQNSFKGNSDSIMILSLNKKLNKVKIISIMRDSFVPIEQDGVTVYKKINSAYAIGGPVKAIKTLNQVFGLDISEYATVNFYGMMDIIDAVGGIEAELTEGEVVTAEYNRHALNGVIKEMCKKLKKDPKSLYITKAGKYQLNGIQAVAYSRIRYVANIWGTNNDYGRTDRQRYVMNQLFDKALKIKKAEYPKLIKALIPCSETSLSYSDIMGLALKFLLNSPSFEETRMPQNEYQMTQPNTSEGSVVYYDIDFAKDVIHAFIYDDVSPDEYVEKNGIGKNDWYGNRYSHNTGSRSSSATSGKSTANNTNSSSNKSSNKSSSSEATKSQSSSGSKNSSASSNKNNGNNADTTDKTNNNATPSTPNTGETTTPNSGTQDTQPETSEPSDSTGDSGGSGDNSQSTPPEENTDTSSGEESSQTE